MSNLIKVNLDLESGRKMGLIVSPEILANYGFTEVNQGFIDKYNEVKARPCTNKHGEQYFVSDPSPVVSWHIGTL